jgi:thioredoxin 1
MVEITAENFEQEVKNETSMPVLVDFWSEKCEKCMALMPDVEELEKKYEGKIKFGKINAQKDRRFCWSLKVMSLPTFQLYKNGEKVEEITQDVTVDKIEEMINKYL